MVTVIYKPTPGGFFAQPRTLREQYPGAAEAEVTFEHNEILIKESGVVTVILRENVQKVVFENVDKKEIENQ